MFSGKILNELNKQTNRRKMNSILNDQKKQKEEQNLKEEQKQKIKLSIMFLSSNIEFFVAMLTSPASIKSLIASEKIESSPLMESMHKAFNNDNHATYYMSMSEFRHAICGIRNEEESQNDEIKGLVDGDKKLIIKYLIENPGMLEAITTHYTDSIMSKWYNNQAQISDNHEPTVQQQDVQQQTVQQQTVQQQNAYGFGGFGLFGAAAVVTAGAIGAGAYLYNKFTT